MKFTIESDKFFSLALCTLAAYAVMFVPEMAAAGPADGGAIGAVLCNVVKVVTGRAGSAIATLAILIVGIGALMGKVSWGMAIIVGIGVGVIFGAPQIVQMVNTGGGAIGGNC